MIEGKLLVKGAIPPPLDRELTVIGKPLNRRGAAEKVTGQAKYSGDIKLPGILYGKTLHCPHPRARIVKIDVTKAAALSGVMALLTKENTNLKTQVVTITLARDSYRAALGDCQRETACLRLAHDAQVAALKSERWKGRLEGLAVGFGAGYIGGRLH